eukprot:7788954-Pyramimonas_sp.AAC.1
MLARIRIDWGCPVMYLGPGHTPKAVSTAGTSTLADQRSSRPFVQRGDLEKQVAQNVDAAMRMAMSP